MSDEFDIQDPAFGPPDQSAPAASLPPEPPVQDLNDVPPAGDAQVPPVAPVAPAPVAPTAPAPAAASELSDVEVRDAKIPGMKESGLTSVEGDQLKTKRILMAQPKVRMMVPLDPGEKPGAYRTVIINGYRTDIKKNVMVDLPESIAQLLADAYRITSEVLDENPLNLSAASDDKRKALGIS